MSKAIEALRNLLEFQYRVYEEALQCEDEARVAYNSGIVSGISFAIEALEQLESV